MRHTSAINTKGFTLIEVMVVALTLGIIMASLLSTLVSTESSRAINSAVSEVQNELRRAMDWIAKDVRQTPRSDIGSIGINANNPLSTHIKFRKVVGYNTTGGGSLALSDNSIEYTYDVDAKTITRIDSGTNQTWTFRNIIQPPFYTNNEGTIIAIDPLAVDQDSPVLLTGNLVVILTGQKQVRGGSNVGYNLTEEVKIRN